MNEHDDLGNAKSDYDAFMDGLEKAILKGHTVRGKEDVFSITLAATKVEEYLESIGIIKFINTN